MTDRMEQLLLDDSLDIDQKATATSGINPFDDKSIEFNIYKQTDYFMS